MARTAVAMTVFGAQQQLHCGAPVGLPAGAKSLGLARLCQREHCCAQAIGTHVPYSGGRASETLATASLRMRVKHSRQTPLTRPSIG